MSDENNNIKGEMDDVIEALEKKGINFNTEKKNILGLGMS